MFCPQRVTAGESEEGGDTRSDAGRREQRPGAEDAPDSVSKRVIFSSALLPSICPSNAIRRATALIDSGHALSITAASMIGPSFSIAVFGSPLFEASSTSFQSASRFPAP